MKTEIVQDIINKLSTKTISPDKLLWLSPTMCPGPTSTLQQYMEDPITTAEWMFANSDDPNTELIAEVKHMGSRCTFAFWRNGESVAWSRNGFNFFDKEYKPLLDQMNKDIFKKIEEDFICIDSEVLPWNFKAAGLVEEDFLLAGYSGLATKQALMEAITKSYTKDIANEPPTENQKKLELEYIKLGAEHNNLQDYIEVVKRYCWDVNIDNIKVAPFYILAIGNRMGKDIYKTHKEHLLALHNIFDNKNYYQYVFAEIINKDQLDILSSLWYTVTDKFKYEGLVLKYNNVNQYSNTKYPQQQLKVRSSDYLKIIYGANYQEPEILEKLKHNRKLDKKMRIAYYETILSDNALKVYLSSPNEFEAYHKFIVACMAVDYGAKEIDPRL